MTSYCDVIKIWKTVIKMGKMVIFDTRNVIKVKILCPNFNILPAFPHKCIYHQKHTICKYIYAQISN